MKNIKFIFPNVLTLLNLLFGCLSILIVFRGMNEYNAAWLIIIAAFFDVLDGLVARALNAQSAFGAELDSLADMVSFGIAPTFILFSWMTLVLTNMSTHSTFAIVAAQPWQILTLACTLLFAVAAALRLAKFNIAKSSTKGFEGLPSTGAALIVASLWLIVGNTESVLISRLTLNLYFLLAIIVLLSGLMISNVGMLSFKLKSLKFKENILQYFLIVFTAVAIVFLDYLGILLSLFMYIFLSVINNVINKIKG